MMNTLAVYGASGHGKVVGEAALASGKWSEILYFDEIWPDTTENGNGIISGNLQTLINSEKKFSFIVAVGDNQTRLNVQKQLINAGLDSVSIIHPSAIVSPSSVIRQGSVILAGALVNSNARVDEGCIVNSHAVVEHDCHLEPGVHISPSASLAGGVFVGKLSWVGIGASIIQQVRIENNVTVGAGAVVTASLPANITAVGVPAKIINKDKIC